MPCLYRTKTSTQSINQPINQPINRSINQPINRSSDQSIAVIFGTVNMINKYANINLNYQAQQIELLDRFKYLGVILDSQLTFRDHVQYIYGKVIPRLRLLGKARQVTGKNTCLFLYKSLIMPMFDYADIIYDCLFQRETEKLQKLQNSAMRIILKRDIRVHTADMLVE